MSIFYELSREEMEQDFNKRFCKIHRKLKRYYLLALSPFLFLGLFALDESEDILYLLVGVFGYWQVSSCIVGIFGGAGSLNTPFKNYYERKQRDTERLLFLYKEGEDIGGGLQSVWAEERDYGLTGATWNCLLGFLLAYTLAFYNAPGFAVVFFIVGFIAIAFWSKELIQHLCKGICTPSYYLMLEKEECSAYRKSQDAAYRSETALAKDIKQQQRFNELREQFEEEDNDSDNSTENNNSPTPAPKPKR